MQRLLLSLTAVIFTVCPHHALAEDLDSCLISGLRGVSSDVAARMVRQACENKIDNQRRQSLLMKYGEALDSELTYVAYESDYSKNSLKVTVRNDLSRTVTYAELGISMPTAKGECPYLHTRKYLYAVKVKPGASTDLIVPEGTSLQSKEFRICVTARAVRGREPSILDISIGAVSPLSQSQLAVVNQDLNERYATIDPTPSSLRSASRSFREIIEDFERSTRPLK